tara:strand:+ start:685 stop:1098 length:414 start_codon:yes stop_codon:yes gene_type:complete
MKLSISIGVGVVIINNSSEVLLIKRGKEPQKGLWSIPGGHLNFGETLKNAAIREIYEETNLIISELEFLDTIDLFEKNRQGELIKHYVLIDFKTYRFSGIAKAGSDADAFKWVSKNNINDFIVWEETIRIINKAFEG